MFTQKEIPKYQLMLETELEQQLHLLKTHVSRSEEYVATLGYIERLYEMMEREKPSPISKDVLLSVGANLLGIVMIIKHERVNVISSKALGFVTRTRI